MSLAVRTSQTPYFCFHRSSTPGAYSVGKPTLNCCGGSFRTLGNMNRPVAASAAAEAAVNAPHAKPIHARRLRRGDVSSSGLVLAAGFDTSATTLVVFPARFAVGTGGGFGCVGRAT